MYELRSGRKCAQEKERMRMKRHEDRMGANERGNQMKGVKPMTDQTSLKNLLQKPGLLIKYATRERRGGKQDEETKRRDRKTQRSRQVPMNLQLALTAMVTLCRAKKAGCSDRSGHVEA